MSEPIWCDIHVKYPASWGERPWFCDMLADALINGYDDEVEPGVWSFHGEGNYGLYDSEVEEALDWLRTHRIPFVAHSDTKYEFSADHWVYDGKADNLVTFEGDTERAMLDEATWRKIDAGEHPDFPTVEAYFTRAERGIADLEVDHLPAELPEWEPA